MKSDTIQGCSMWPKSPSVWRVWIEIVMYYEALPYGEGSPSVWRVWIEIKFYHLTL